MGKYGIQNKAWRLGCIALWLLLLLFMVHAAYAQTSGAESVPAGQNLDRIVALVNDDIITAQALQQRVKQLQHQFAGSGNLPAAQTLRAQLLQHMVLERIQLQMAARAKLVVSDAELAQAMRRMPALHQVSEAQMRALVRAEGLTLAEFKAQLRDQLLIHKLQRAALQSAVVVDDAAIANELKILQKHNHAKQQWHIVDLVVEWGEQPQAAARAQAKQTAQTLLRQARAAGPNLDLAALAAKQTAVATQDLGWRTAAQLPAVFHSALQQCSAGQVRGPIKAPNGYHLLHCVGHRAAQPVSRAVARNVAYQKAYEVALARWLTDIRQKAFVEIK